MMISWKKVWTIFQVILKKVWSISRVMVPISINLIIIIITLLNKFFHYLSAEPHNDIIEKSLDGFPSDFEKSLDDFPSDGAYYFY